MTNGATITYVIPEPFERGLKLVRRALHRAGLGVSAELDLSSRLEREMGVASAPCRVLCVDTPVALLEALALHTPAAVFLPLHVVVSGRGAQSKIHVMNPAKSHEVGLPLGAKVPINRLQAQLLEALETVATRQSAFELIP